MNSKLCLQDLWASLSQAEIEAGCLSVLQPDYPGGEKIRDIVLDALAVAIRFRPVFLRRRSAAENLPLLMRWSRSRDFDCFHGAVLFSLMMVRYSSICGAFLDASNVPHKNGFVDGDPTAPAPSQLEAGISRILAQYKARDVGLLLGFSLLLGGELFSGLPEALTNKEICIVDLLQGEQSAPTPATESVSKVEATRTAVPEDTEVFTTLDSWLIHTSVASAFGESGAHTPEQLEDLVEEVVSLNAQRQHTLFHRGYLHALFGKPYVFHFPGENEERRLWYLTGVLFGLLRAHKHDDVMRLLKDNSDLVNQLCDNTTVRCGSMLLPQLYPIFWEAKEFGMCQRWLEKHLTGLPMHRLTYMIIQLHYDASSLVRRGLSAEAEGFLNLLDDVVRNGTGFPDGFSKGFLPANDRKRAQVLQLKGEFHGAEALLESLSETEELEDAGNVMCDLALIRAGFRSLVAALPSKDEATGLATAGALEHGRELLEKAVRSHPASATNANLCLGLMTVLQRKGSQAAADHLSAALAGMLKKEDAYTEGGLIQWTRFLLGLALLETAELSDFQNARDRIEQSIQTVIVFPIWLWSRALQAASLFDDQSLGQRIAEHLLNKRGSDAYRAIWESGLARSVGSLRQTYLAWLEEAPLPVQDKWHHLKILLPAALKDANIQQGEIVLDQMEGLAVQGGIYRTEFLQLLEHDRNYSPAWEIENAQNVRIKLLEREGNLPDAVALLRARFFTLRQAGDPNSLQNALATLDWMSDLGADTSDLQSLRNLFPTVSDSFPPDGCPLKAGAAVYVLYIGGNETQKTYEIEIRSELVAVYPGLKIEFYYPGWDSRWNVHLDRVRPKIYQADAVVLSTMVRTQFGRHVRASCNSSAPWFPCTGRGKMSLKRSIQRAAIWSANKKRQ